MAPLSNGWLLKVTLRQRQKEEEDLDEKKEKEQAAETRRRAQALVDHAASLPKRKRKKKRKRKLPRNSSCPRLASSGYKFLPRSWRLFGTNSTQFLREGGPWLLRSILAALCPLWLSSGPRCPASWSVWTRRTFMPRYRDRFRCSRCTHLETWTFCEPLVSGSYLFGACLA